MAGKSALDRAQAEGIASGRLLPGERLAAPADLTPEEAAEWNQIMEPLPAGFITVEHTTMLRELCRCTVFARSLGDMITRMLGEPQDDESLCRLQAMMKTHGFQVEKIVLLSRNLRITKTSREDRTKVERSTKHATAVRKPWHDWSNDVDDTPQPTIGNG